MCGWSDVYLSLVAFCLWFVFAGTSALFDEGFVSKTAQDINEALREKGFARMRTDPDEERLGEDNTATAENVEELVYVGPMSQAYPRYLEKAATMKFTKFEVMKPIYISGCDSYNRPVVVVCGAHFQHDEDESEHAFLFVSMLFFLFWLGGTATSTTTRRWH